MNIENEYSHPYEVYIKNFINCNKEEFDKIFVTFGIKKDEFIKWKENNPSYILIEDVIFDLSKGGNLND